MLVGLMYYGLYSLSKLITSVSELWKTPCVYINGREVGDGPYVQLPETHLHSLNTHILTAADTRSRDTEGTVEGGDPLDSRDVKDEKPRRPQEELNEEMCDNAQKMLSDLIQMGSAAVFVKKEKKAACEHHLLTKGLDENKCLEEVALVPAAPDSQLKCADISSVSPDLIAELYFSVNGGDTLAKTGSLICDDGPDTHLGTCCSDILSDFDSGTEGLFMHSRPVFDLRALLAEDQGVQLFTEPIGWHFPVGVGLSDMLYSPYVHLPGISYYPEIQSIDNIEVMWRVWEDLSESSADRAAVFEFSIMSYNILAQDLLEANPELYTHCTEEVLVWDLRLPLILQELHVWRPDVVCLQEVQEEHFLHQMYPVLTQMGYTCVYKRRTGTRTDGCAVCYSRERFTQLSVSLLEFHRSDCQLLNRDNVGIVLLLQPITEEGDSFSPICVANTHLLFNPRRGDVKLAQLVIVLAEIDSMIKKCQTEGKSCEVILCGDFNTLPNTPLWKFITSGELYYHGLPAWMVSGQVDLSDRFHHRRLFAPLWPDSLGITDSCQYSVYSDTQAKGSERLKYSHSFLHQLRYCEMSCGRPSDLQFLPGVTDNTPDPEEVQMFSPRFRHSLFHSLNLTSAYLDTHPNAQKRVVTTLNSEGGAMVDYIFYSTRRHGCAQMRENDGGLKLVGRLSLLSEVDLWSFRGLPNKTFPSDHLSLVASFQLS